MVTRVASADGTEIAYWTSGEGPPLVLVHGATADHNRWGPLLPYLERSFTVHAMDRRGRGGSGDAPGYSIAREFEDVAVVVDAVAGASGSVVDIYGHSYGGLCVFGGATLTSNIGNLVLYDGGGLSLRYFHAHAGRELPCPVPLFNALDRSALVRIGRATQIEF
jgi:pimeloyl-ACP methyl ester carboxylesterase